MQYASNEMASHKALRPGNRVQLRRHLQRDCSDAGPFCCLTFGPVSNTGRLDGLYGRQFRPIVPTRHLGIGMSKQCLCVSIIVRVAAGLSAQVVEAYVEQSSAQLDLAPRCPESAGSIGTSVASKEQRHVARSKPGRCFPEGSELVRPGDQVALSRLAVDVVDAFLRAGRQGASRECLLAGFRSGTRSATVAACAAWRRRSAWTVQHP